MSALDPRVQFAIPEFLRTLDMIQLGEPQSEAVLEHPKMMAATVLYLMAGGDETQLDIGDLSTASLARATIDLCDNPLSQEAIAAFEKARGNWLEVNPH